MPIEKLAKGRIVSHKEGKFLLVEKSLEDIEEGKIKNYIEKHKEGLYLESLRRRFKPLTKIPKKKMFFFDIETAGRTYASPIISIAFANLSTNPKFECIFARDPSEEIHLLKYFFKVLQENQAFFTYNGGTFDFTRLSERARQNGIMIKKDSERYQTLKELISSQHYDLYRYAKERYQGKLLDLKLQTLEKHVLDFNRKNDLPGAQIPDAYMDYLNRVEGSEEEMARLINHNIDDTASLIALLCHFAEN